MIGAVGISGGTVAQDLAVAEAVRDVLDQMVLLHDRLASALPDFLAIPGQARRFGRQLRTALEQEGMPLPDGWADVLTGALLLHARG